MITNPVIDTLMRRSSVRAYRQEMPSEEVIETIVRAGQQAPFAMQLCSVLLERGGKIPWGAPINFSICIDVERIRLIAEKRGWQVRLNDLLLLLFGLQDAAYMAQNMVIAAESLGLGSCFIGAAPMMAPQIVERFHLPPKVFPLVMLVMGYPSERQPRRPRYPLSFTLFEGEYPELSDEAIEEAMQVMDEGYLAQDYYRKLGAMIPIQGDRAETETPETYSWTEHISRKLQWHPSGEGLLENLRRCGFDLCPSDVAPDTGSDA
ncbi:MAG: nitroreductase family protein [Candidatus Eisenbacteria sp.]|nr:nitroreductase family protein [Candidatus Eisenbacteria bacterium]